MLGFRHIIDARSSHAVDDQQGPISRVVVDPEAMVVLTAGGGWIDGSMTGFADGLVAALTAPRTLRGISRS